MREFLSQAEEKKVFDAARVDGTYMAGSGRVLDGQFEFGRIADDSEEFFIVRSALAKLIKSRQPETIEIGGIISIANGSTRLGGPIAEELGVQHIPTFRHDDKTGFYLLPDADLPKRVVMIDDVFTTGKTSRQVANALADRNITVEHLAVLLDRSDQPSPTIHQAGHAVPVNALSRVYERRV